MPKRLFPVEVTTAFPILITVAGVPISMEPVKSRELGAVTFVEKAAVFSIVVLIRIALLLPTEAPPTLMPPLVPVIIEFLNH